MKGIKRRHPPERTCLGCGVRDDQNLLFRFVARENGELQLDKRGKGRGGYLHKEERCWETFLRKKSLYRALRVEFGREAREKLILGLRHRYRE
ncbi:MAG: YlxR family protein [Candidatus Binatia bacterium]